MPRKKATTTAPAEGAEAPKAPAKKATPKKATPKKATAYKVLIPFGAPGFNAAEGDIILAKEFPKGSDWAECFCEPVEG